MFSNDDEVTCFGNVCGTSEKKEGEDQEVCIEGVADIGSIEDIRNIGDV